MSTSRQRAQWRATSARWKRTHPDHARRYYLRNKAKIAGQQRQRLAKDSSTHRRLMKKWRLAKQRELHSGMSSHCPICKQRLAKPYADHCHKTARRICKHVAYKACLRCRRAVICPKCNWVLGLVQDDTKTLERARQYLLKWNRILRRRK